MNAILVAQKGAREHYLAAKALHARGALAGLVTDVYTPTAGRFLFRCACRCTGSTGKRLRARRTNGLPPESVRSAGMTGLGWWLTERLATLRGRAYDGYLATDRAFAGWVAGLSLPPHDVYFGYSYASLEALQAEKQKGVFTVLDQIDAGRVHDRMREEEAAKWPGYAVAVDPAPEAYYERVRHEWDAADLIVVNSDWTRDALRQQGVAKEKMVVIPLAYEQGDDGLDRERAPAPPPLRVLWLGSVTLTKGIPYLVEAARVLINEPVSFTVAGPLGIRPEAVQSAPPNIEWLGQVPRLSVSSLYREHHVFVLPTVSDGFAITQLEAMAHGLPVIITPNCGRVVQDDETGFVITPFSTDALVEGIRRFLRSPELRHRMAEKCPLVAAAYSIERYGAQLLDAIIQRKRLKAGE